MYKNETYIVLHSHCRSWPSSSYSLCMCVTDEENSYDDDWFKYLNYLWWAQQCCAPAFSYVHTNDVGKRRGTFWSSIKLSLFFLSRRRRLVKCNYVGVYTIYTCLMRSSEFVRIIYKTFSYVSYISIIIIIVSFIILLFLLFLSV